MGHDARPDARLGRASAKIGSAKRLAAEAEEAAMALQLYAPERPLPEDWARPRLTEWKMGRRRRTREATAKAHQCPFSDQAEALRF